MLMLMNQKELKQIYNYESDPVTIFDYANNIGYAHGASSWNNNLFEKELDKLVNEGILIKVYDYIENGFREGLYEFYNNTGQIEFIGENYMNYKLFLHY